MYKSSYLDFISRTNGLNDFEKYGTFYRRFSRLSACNFDKNFWPTSWSDIGGGFDSGSIRKIDNLSLLLAVQQVLA